MTPQTGPLASFGTADKYCVDHFNEVIGDGLLCGDGKLHPITILLEDSQSNSNRSAQVAGDLITNSKVDILMAASSGDNVVPVSDQAEAFEVPCISCDTPWQAWFMGRGGDPAVGFKWTYHAFWGQEDNFGIYFDLWSQVPNNKIVGVLWPNDVDGNNYRDKWPEPMTKAGYTIVDGGSFQDGTEDYTSIIDKFKKEGAEILSGVMSPPDFTNFWTQSKQQGYTPKICGIGKALLFPQTADALGDIGEGLCTTVWWHPTYPFTSPLTGETCQQFADNYETKTGMQWTQPLLHFMVFEWAVDSLKRTKDIDDKNQIIAAIAATKVETIVGPCRLHPASRRGRRHASGTERGAHSSLGWSMASGGEVELRHRPVQQRQLADDPDDQQAGASTGVRRVDLGSVGPSGRSRGVGPVFG